MALTYKIIFIIFFNIMLLAKSEDIKREGRDFHGYYPGEEEKKVDYQYYPYPPSYYPPKDVVSECVNNPMLPLLGKGLNLLMLKLGVFGIIKAVMALFFLGFLVKLPLILLKFTFLKSLFLPLLLAPLLLQDMLTQPMTKPSESTMNEKPSEDTAGMEGMMEMTDMNIGRQISDNLTSTAWQSLKMFVDSDQCVERISCIIGASNSDSSMGMIFSRMLKYLHYSSPPSLQKRMLSIKEAYNKGSRTSTCLAEDYICHTPELLIQQGISKIKIL